MRRTFIELPAFTRLVSAGRLGDAQVSALQEDILNGGGATMSGTGGVRKIRCPDRGGGKSGGWRVLFADYEREDVTVLIWAFPKNEQANLAESQKKVVRGLKAPLDNEIKVRDGREERVL
jgi:hypothetical protein